MTMTDKVCEQLICYANLTMEQFTSEKACEVIDCLIAIISDESESGCDKSIVLNSLDPALKHEMRTASLLFKSTPCHELKKALEVRVVEIYDGIISLLLDKLECWGLT